MAELPQPIPADQTNRVMPRHKRWVRWVHWVVTLSFFLLLYTGIEILMVHPRLYWGETGNDLTPALFELPISRNYHHGGWDTSRPFIASAGSPVSASRTYEIFNQNGWGRSLHFLSGWFLVAAGLVYLLTGMVTGYFKNRLVPGRNELKLQYFWDDFVRHFKTRSTVEPARYGLLQKYTYMGVVFFVLPLTVITGLTMSPAITAACPFLLTIFGGMQSARTIHFFLAVLLVLFLVAHVVMVIRSGFRKQMRAMTIGE